MTVRFSEAPVALPLGVALWRKVRALMARARRR